MASENSHGSTCHLWCYTTIFACRLDSLRLAKARYRERIKTVQEKCDVQLASEQAYMLGQSEPLFHLLTLEIKGTGIPMSEKESEDYSLFIFTTIAEVPEIGNDDGDLVRWVAAALELDDEDEYPAVFPSRTRSVMVLPPDELSESCIDQ